MTAPSPNFILFVKDPTDVCDYTLTWAAELGADTITNSVFSTTDTHLTITQSSFTNTTTTVWVSGGVIGRTSVVNHVTTAGGRQFTQTITLRIKDT